jgi:surface protein
VNEAAAQTGDYTCNYAAAGTYTVRIKDNSGAGTGFPHICFDCGGDKLKLLTIEQWGKGKWTSMAWAFAGCANLAGQATDSPDLSGVTDMSWMFASASAFNQDIGNWNTVSVTDMSYMFYDASAFNQDIGNWNTANVTDMSGMFYYASAFNQDLGGWNVGALTDASYMFTGVTLSTPNYDALLIGWDAQTLHSGVTFNGGYSKYCAGEAARSNMISSDHWNITDGGKQCPPAVAPAVTASKNPGSNDVILSWDDNAANAGGYVIWYSETPYFLPDDPAAQSILRPAGSTGWTHASAAGDPAHNYYYIVQGINAAGDRSAASNRTGVFGFSMTPGALNLR